MNRLFLTRSILDPGAGRLIPSPYPLTRVQKYAHFRLRMGASLARGAMVKINPGTSGRYLIFNQKISLICVSFRVIGIYAFWLSGLQVHAA